MADKTLARLSIGGTDYEVPELSIYAIKETAKMARRLDALQAQDSSLDTIDEAMDITTGIVLLWLGEAHPELTTEALQKKMTLSDVQRMGPTIIAALSGSGVEPGGSQGAPEAAVAAPVLA